ncbi:FkbM family methyltransferase [Alkalimarinus alittae]|uniref:FkbM family methyltransferase n=1 Tax=Alkalimarinus alittae TaxID=2961619 RepID=A0ABY6N6E7_9ALTE|nr:FkbM family methyltransferase [Alkalimarinus alittae]UZE97562.1 FkbM family methyltransferase [Alkalimarinus alittae]
MNRLKEEVYVFGNTEYTPHLKTIYTVKGIIDEQNPNTSIWGIPNISLCDISKSEKIINTVNNSRAYQVQKRLIDDGFTKTIFIGDIINEYPAEFESTFLTQAQSAMRIDYEALLHNLDNFSDDLSKEEFKNILDFRLTLKIDHLSAFKVKINQQYYEDFLLKCDFKALIDGGAYDGEDSKRFIEFFPSYKQVIVLEPSDSNRLLVGRKLHNYPNVHIIKACLGESNGYIRFDGEGTSAKTVLEGGVKVEQRTIDSFEIDQRTLVKLDIEGAEMAALKGASKAFENPDYSFAISAYHLPHDLLNILKLFKSSLVKRKLYFRHYSGGICESVLFAI